MELKEYAIIPDVHNKYRKALDILTFLPPDMGKVWVGDYVDDFHETVEDVEGTIKMLRARIDTTDDIFLVGNHDMAYFSTHPLYKCSGYEEWKQDLWFKYFTREEMATKFQPTVQIPGPFYISHAGMGPWQYDSLKHGKILEDYQAAVRHGIYSQHFGAGRARGGIQKDPGITWRDFYEEFKPVPGVPQIFGHTPTRTGLPIKWAEGITSENWAIDTHLRTFVVVRPQKDPGFQVKVFVLSSIENGECERCGLRKPEVFYHAGRAVCSRECAEEAEGEDR